MAEEVNLSFTQFINYTALNPNRRAQYVKKLKYDNEYEFANDYWGILRQSIPSFHRKNKDISYLDSLPNQVSTSRRDNYRFAIETYKQFLKSQGQLEWFDPPSRYFHADRLHININPELGFVNKGKLVLIKMFFTEDGLLRAIDKGKADIMFYLMREALNQQTGKEYKFGILNMKNAKLQKEAKPPELLDLNVESHIIQFLHLWDHL